MRPPTARADAEVTTSDVCCFSFQAGRRRVAALEQGFSARQPPISAPRSNSGDDDDDRGNWRDSCWQCRRPVVPGQLWTPISNGEVVARFHQPCHAEWLIQQEVVRDLIKVLTAGDAAASVTSRSRRRSIPRCPPYGVIARQTERIRRRSRTPASIPSRSSRKRSSTGGVPVVDHPLIVQAVAS